MKGLWVKLLGGLAFALVYTFYFEYGGDSRAYFRDSQKVISALFVGPSVYWEVLRHHFEGVSSEALDILMRMSFHAKQEYFVANFISFFNLLGCGSYFSTTLLIAFFSYWGVWHFFLLLADKFPKIEKQMAFAALFVPSVFFWGSGIGKDSLIFCALGLVLYHVNQLAGGRIWQLKSILLIASAGYFMFVVKPYVLISLLPAIALWRTLHFRDTIKNAYLKAAVLPVVGVISVFAMVYTLDIMAQYNQRYSVNSFVDTAQSMQGWHYQEGHNTSEENGRGSSYTLGAYDESTWRGLLRIFPAAVNVTYFRPYMWEVKNAGMLAQAFESLLFLLFSVFTLIKVGPFKVYRFISGDSFLLMCVVFAIFFGFAVGFSSYNFGALSRYKIPAVPFFVAALFIVRYKARALKQERVDQRVGRRRVVRGSLAKSYAG